MGQLRTINHPGIEIFEVDASGATEQVGGCTSLVVGFFPQGESAVPVNPTSLKSVKSYFGTPETEAERYAYYACKTVFDNGGKLIAARIPYDNNSQYLTPAVKYNIEEWSTSHISDYDKVYVKSYMLSGTNVYTSSEHEQKSDFYNAKTPKIESLLVEQTKTFDGTTWTKPVSGNVLCINSDNKTGTASEYYTLEFNGPFYTSKTFRVGTVDYTVKSYIKSFTSSNATDTEFSNIMVHLSSDYELIGDGIELSLGNTESTSSTTFSGDNGKLMGELNSSGNLNGKLIIQRKLSDSYEPVVTLAYNDLIYQSGWTDDGTQKGKTTLSEGMVLKNKLFSSDFSKYFTINRLTDPKYSYSIEYENVLGYYDEVRTSVPEKRSNFLFDSTLNQPTTAFVEKFTETDTVTAIAIKSYFKEGEGIIYPKMTSDDFLELKVWEPATITALSSLTEGNLSSFDILENVYSGNMTSETSKISDGNFKAAPVTADVSTGYVGKYGSITVTSELMRIHAQEGAFDPSTEPEIIEVNNPVGNGKIKVLKKLNNGTVLFTGESDMNKNDFYRFVSPVYSKVESVALAASNNYYWIHYTVNTSLSETGEFKDRIITASILGCETSAVPEALSKIENVVSIIPDSDNLGYIPLADYLDYRDEAKKVEENTIVIANITEQKFEKDSFNNTNDEVSNGEEVLGIVPVLMSGFQALPKQSRVELPSSITNSKIFNALETIVRGSSIENDPAPKADHVDVKSVVLNKSGFVKKLGNTESYDPYESTYSNDALSKVPAVDLNSNYKPNGAKTNFVTLAVCKLSISSVNDNKVALTVMESFTGSLDSNAKDDKGNSEFIDFIVNNEETGSAYVKLFSNYQTSLTGKDIRTAARRELIKPASADTKITVVTPSSCGAEKWWNDDKKMFTMGFTEEQTKKYISYATMVASLENVYDALSNVDETDIDLVVDAGLTSIANRIKKYIDENPEATKAVYDLTFDKINSVQDVAGWKSMAAKLITFCQTTRKDCLALIDSPRSLCVKNNVKLIDSKKTTTSKYSVDFDILPKFNFIGGLNSSYGAGFCNWILAVDDFTAKNIWMPPSIAAEGNIIYTDYNSNYWMAPAGEKRGTIMWAVDIAFNPNGAQQDSIYSKGWNYAISSGGTIMTWGQKTFLTSTSSFNRINVRRLFLRLERLVRKNSKWVLFELNNQKTRNRYLDRIDPIFNNVKSMGGLYDYQLICDERNNPGSVIDANEFRFAALLKPSKVAEYIILTFFNLNTDMQWSEVYGDL